MKTFKQYIAEMDLSKEPMGDVEDRRNQPPSFKAGDKWSTSDASGKTRYVTKKEADAINSGKAKGGSPFPDSWNKETQVASKDKQIIINKTPKGKLPDVPLRKQAEAKPKVAGNDDSSYKTSGYANPEWMKKNSWIKDAVKQNRLKK